MRIHRIRRAVAAMIGLGFLSGCQFQYYDPSTLAAAYSQHGVGTPPPPLAPVSYSGSYKENDKENGKGKGSDPDKYPDNDRSRRGKDSGYGKDDPGRKGGGFDIPKQPYPDAKMPTQHGKAPKSPWDGPDYPQGPGPGHPPVVPPGSGGPGDGNGHAPWPVQPPGGGEDGSRPGLGGESCAAASDGRRSVCLGLKYVVYKNVDGAPVQSDRLAAENLRQVNRLWHECGIQFQIDQFEAIDPERERLRYRTADGQELEQIRRTFMDDRTLLVVMTGAWDRSGTLGRSWANAWTNLPGEASYGAVLERTVSGDPNILAHELGHYLSLGHAEEPGRLMHPMIYRDSTRLSPDECRSARWAIHQFWPKMIRAAIPKPID